MEPAFKKFKESMSKPPSDPRSSTYDPNSNAMEVCDTSFKFEITDENDENALTRTEMVDVAAVFEIAKTMRKEKEAAASGRASVAPLRTISPYSVTMATLFQEELDNHGLFPLINFADEQKWLSKMQKFSYNRMVSSIEKDQFSTKADMEALTEYALKKLPKSILEEVEYDVEQAVEKTFENVPLIILPEDEQENRRVDVIQRHLEEFTERQKSKEARKLEKTRQIQCNVMGIGVGEFHGRHPYLMFNYDNTSSCRTPNYPDIVANDKLSAIDPEELNKILSELWEEPEVTDLESALDPKLGLILTLEDGHSRIIDFITAHKLDNSHPFEDIATTLDDKFYIFTCYYDGVWYKLAVKKEDDDVLEDFDDITSDLLKGCWVSKVVPEMRQGFSMDREGMVKKRPLTQEEQDAIAMPPPMQPVHRWEGVHN
uniref:Tudor domain-containing protein n=1 Tax=Panagrellus redivivus TaxID=6233 RepID=A0A7E4WAQ3_PANRE